MALDHEKPEQQDQRDRDHIGLEQRGRDLQAFDRAQHRDRRGDHPVAVEQRGANQARRHDPEIALAVPAGRAQHQRGQRQQAAFAAVVGAHDDRDVFDRDDQHQRPEDQRQRAEDRVVAGIVECQQRLANGIERRGADVAIDDAEGGDRQIAGGLPIQSARPHGNFRRHQLCLGTADPMPQPSR